MATVTPKICVDAGNADVFSVPGESRQEGGGSRVRHVVITLRDADVGNLLLPNGAEISISENVAFTFHVVGVRAWNSGANTDKLNVVGSGHRIGSGTAVLDSVPTVSDFTISISGTNTLRFHYDHENDVQDIAFAVTLVEVDIS